MASTTSAWPSLAELPRVPVSTALPEMVETEHQRAGVRRQSRKHRHDLLC